MDAQEPPSPADYDRNKDLAFLKRIKNASLEELYVIWYEHTNQGDGTVPEWQSVAMQRAFERHGCF